MITPFSEVALRGLNFVPFVVRLCGAGETAQVAIPTGIIPAQTSELLLVDSWSGSVRGTFSGDESVVLRVVLAGTATPVSASSILDDAFLMSPALVSESAVALQDGGTALFGEVFAAPFPVYAPLLSITLGRVGDISNANIIVSGRIFYSLSKVSSASQLALVSRAQCGNTLGVVPEECPGT